MTKIIMTWLLFFSLLGLACAAPYGSLRADPTRIETTPATMPAVTLSPLPSSTITQTPTPSPTPVLSPTPVKTCRVNTGYPAGYLNLRAGPGLSYAVIAVLVEGDQLIVNQPGAWSEVTVCELTGWIYSNYLTCEETP